jgi:hypothetical protein
MLECFSADCLSCREGAALSASEDLARDAPVDHVEDRFEIVRAPILRVAGQVSADRELLG